MKDHQITAQLEQVAAKALIKKYLSTSNNPILLTGPAGTGKTSLLIQLLADGTLTLSDTTFVYISNKALQVLQNELNSQLSYNDDEARFMTITAFLNKKLDYDDDGNKIFVKHFNRVKIKYRKVLVVDECSMIDDPTYEDIMKIANSNNIKVIFSGDRYQCPPPNDNPAIKVFNIACHVQLKTPFRYNKEMGKVMSNVINSIDNPIDPKDLLQSMKLYGQNINANVTFYSNKKEFIDKAISYSKNNMNSMVLAYKNDTVKKMADYIRSQIIDDISLEYQKDDILICESVANRFDFTTTSELYKVIRTEMMTCILTDKYDIESVDSINYMNDLRLHKNIPMVLDLYKLYLNKSSTGRNDYVYIPMKSQLDAYEKFKKDIKKSKAISNYTKGSLCNAFPEFNYGYAINIYKAQGSSYDSVFIYLDDILDLKATNLSDKYKALYTAMSRAKTEVHILLTK